MSSQNTGISKNDQSNSASAAKHGPRMMLARIMAFALQKIWLPQTLYTLIPFFYLFAGAAALLSALYAPSLSWFLPYALLAAGIAFHAAIAIGVARYSGYRKMAAMKLAK